MAGRRAEREVNTKRCPMHIMRCSNFPFWGPKLHKHRKRGQHEEQSAARDVLSQIKQHWVYFKFGGAYTCLVVEPAFRDQKVSSGIGHVRNASKDSDEVDDNEMWEDVEKLKDVIPLKKEKLSNAAIEEVQVFNDKCYQIAYKLLRK